MMLTGCSYYAHKPLADQPLMAEQPHLSYEKVYPFLEVYNPQEIDAMIDDCRDSSCQFQTFAAFWEYYHDQWSDAQFQTQKILQESLCSLSHDSGSWLHALLYEDKTHWNKGLMALDPIFQNPSQTFYVPALGLSYRLQKARKTSVSHLSPEEKERIDIQKNILNHYQNPPVSPIHKYHVVVLYEQAPSVEFFKSFVTAFEHQEAIESFHFFSRESPRKAVLDSLKHPNSLLVGYYLSQSLPKEYLMESKASITVGEDFIKHRSVDYWVADPMVQMLQSFNQDPFCLKPEMILYEEGILSSKVQSTWMAPYKAINLSTLGVEQTLQNLMQMPQREPLFHMIFPNNMTYRPRADLLPHTILCCVQPETLKTIHAHFKRLGQKNTLLLANSANMSRNLEDNKALHGVLMDTHPFEKQPQYRDRWVHGGDLIDLLIRLPRFAQEASYVYHGHMGAYTLAPNQQLRYQRWWVRYYDRDRAALSTASKNEVLSTPVIPNVMSPPLSDC